MAVDPKTLQTIEEQSSWYASRSRQSRRTYIWLKGIQIVFAAAIPVIAVAVTGDIQRWITAALGALIGIIEGFLQLGQYQQNWLLYRATRAALRREEFLHAACAGPYVGVPDPDRAYIERCDAVISGEHSNWLQTQQQAVSQKRNASAG